MKRILTTVLLLCLPLGALAQNEGSTAAEDLLQRLLSGLTNVEYETVVSLFADDVLFWGTSMQTLGTGKSAPEEYFSTLRGQEPGRNVASAVDHSVLVLSDDLQLLSGTWKVDMAATGNSVTFRTSIAVARRDGEWKIVQFHNSAVPPQP